MGMDMGPIRAKNQEMVRPRTPPKCSASSARTTVRIRKNSVETRATINSRRGFILRKRGERNGSMSLVMTAEMVFVSEEHIDIVLAKHAASTRPTKPEGRNRKTSIG